MATFSPGTSSVKSTSLEAVAVELAQMLQNHERANTAENAPNNIAVNYFTGDNVVTIDATFPITQSQDANGNTVFTAVDYYTDATFNAGDSELGSADLIPACLEVFQKIQALEVAQGENHVTLVYNTETLIATLTVADMPITFDIDANGAPKIVASPYLA